MAGEIFYCCGCKICGQTQRNMKASSTNSISSIVLILLLGIVNLPCGLTHIASVLETDGAPGMPLKPRGPTVPPVPSPETLEQLEMNSRGNNDDDTITGIFSPREALRNLLTFSTVAHHHGLPGYYKRVSQFHGNGDFGLATGTGAYIRPPPQLQSNWDYDENDMSQDEEDGKPTFVPFIGARALTNIPQFFEHLKENIEALKNGPNMNMVDSNNLSEEESVENQDNLEGVLPKKDMMKPAARRLKTELLVDEDVGRTQSANGWTPTNNQGWKPRAAGVVHYYSSRPKLLETQQQNILRRANNYNPAWLYTNLGLGKRRR